MKPAAPAAKGHGNRRGIIEPDEQCGFIKKTGFHIIGAVILGRGKVIGRALRKGHHSIAHTIAEQFVKRIEEIRAVDIVGQNGRPARHFQIVVQLFWFLVSKIGHNEGAVIAGCAFAQGGEVLREICLSHRIDTPGQLRKLGLRACQFRGLRVLQDLCVVHGWLRYKGCCWVMQWMPPPP